MQLHALIEDAADGRLPGWAELGRRRMEHCRRVALLMDEWAAAFGLPPAEAARWRATAWLHDCMKGAPADELRLWADEPHRELPEGLLHGPAAAGRLRADGVFDEPLLAAITWHTTGHAELDRLGHALYVADFIEPGRRYTPVALATMRARMPDSLDSVLRQVVCTRLNFLLAAGRAVRPDTVAFWNRLSTKPAAGR